MTELERKPNAKIFIPPLPYFLKWPERVWEQSPNGWTSRPATEDDRAQRRDVEARLAARRIR